MHRPAWRVLAILCIGFLSTAPAAAQLLIAHRGASHDAPENTLAAFRLAWERGADGIEGDFRLTSDGRIVCLHDKDTERVAGKKLVAAESTLAALQSLDVGSWKHAKHRGERPPTLRQVMATVPEGKLFFLEVKCGPEIIGPLKRSLADSDLDPSQVIIISFNERVIRACSNELPNYRTQWLTSFKKNLGRWTPTATSVVETLLRSGAEGLGCKAEPGCVDAEFLSTLSAAGFDRFGVWTVDDVATARLFRSAGAWSITTNRPGWLREQLSSNE